MGAQHGHMMEGRAGTGGVVRRLTAVLELGEARRFLSIQLGSRVVCVCSFSLRNPCWLRRFDMMAKPVGKGYLIPKKLFHPLNKVVSRIMRQLAKKAYFSPCRRRERHNFWASITITITLLLPPFRNPRRSRTTL
jgi:hypothetical protein